MPFGFVVDPLDATTNAVPGSLELDHTVRRL
jgi:hypothetical protein